MNTENNTPHEVATQYNVEVPLTEITIPGDARPHSQEDIDSRAISMARDGQEQSALLSKEGDKLVLVYGHGRYLSAQKANLPTLRCDIKEGLTESQKLLLILSENNERQGASPFYTANLYSRIMAAENLTSEQLPDFLKKSRTTVYNYLGLLNLPGELKSMSNRLDIGLRNWLEIGKLPKPEDQLQLAQECAENDYSVRELEAKVKALLGQKEEAKAPKAVAPFQFRWKGQELVMKVRPFCPAKEHWTNYASDLAVAVSSRLLKNPAPFIK